MMSKRTDRVQEATKEVLSEVIQRELKDPRIGFVTITRVDVSPDLRHAKVHFSVLGTPEEVERTIEGLKSSRGFMRAELGKHLRMKYLPEIELVREAANDEAIRLSKLLRKVEEELEEEGDGGESGI